MGIWGTVAVFETYFTILRLGVVNGMNRELPYALGQGKDDRAMQYAQTTLAYTIFIIIFIVACIPFMVYKLDLDKIYLSAIGVFSVKIILSAYNTYLTGTFRSNDHFDKLSNIQFIVLLTKLVALPLILLGFYGYLAMELLFILTQSFLFHHYRPFKLKPFFNKTVFIKLIKVGFPVFLTSYAITFIDTFPRLFIIKFGNEYLMGLYAPIIMLFSALSLLPNTLITYMYPKFSFQLGQKNDNHKVFKTLFKIYSISFAFILFSVIILFLFMDYFGTVFPKYKESIPYLKISLLVCPFVIYKIGNTLNAVYKKYNYMVWYAIAYFVIQICTLFVLNSLNVDILQTAIYSQFITYLLMFIISLLMNYRLVKSS